ncbi:ricin-type beta-trefoil lectin domain protein [Streptomyces sp. NPDC047022]|uniref:ricin-type beta-trefoil lectin domain protein n=1 Tax=Streptomyces sp. NPDC047022 TaxID=3155737 RepID=UPI0033F376BD
MKDGVQQDFPGPVPLYDVTDEQLAAELKKAAGKRPVHHPVGELLGRHWEAAYSYARLLTDGAHPAGMLTTAAFTRLFEDSARQGGPTAAWRPHLLVAIRRLAGEWDTDHRYALLDPALRSGPGTRERAAVRLLPPENRRLVSRAFQRLSEPARCLLWHVEVEREDIAVPAALLGIDPGDAAMRLARARTMLREACLDIHREYAPDEHCRRYARLLDVSLRRDGGLIDLDLRRHMDGCPHCHNAAEQLEGFGHRLPLLLAEGVLGWGAQAYLDTRGAPEPRSEAPPTPAPWPVGGEPLIDPADVRPAPPATKIPAPPEAAAPFGGFGDGPPDAPGGGIGRLARAESAEPATRCSAGHRAPGRSPQPWQLALAVAAVGALVVVPLAVWSGSGGQPDAVAAKPSGSPGPSSTSGAESPSWVGTAAVVPTGAFEGRLRNQESGLCVGLDRKDAVAGAEAVLVSCDSSATQQWAYTADGLLRSAAARDLCLDSHLGYSVQLAACAGRSEPSGKNVRYAFTRQGSLIPGWNQDLALTPASSDQDAGLVLKPRTGDGTQRWFVDASNAPRAHAAD